MGAREKLSLRRFSKPAQVRELLEEKLPKQATPEQVKEFVSRQGLECSDLIDDVIYCSSPAKRLLFVFPAKWLIEFHFDSGKLANISVSIGYITP